MQKNKTEWSLNGKGAVYNQIAPEIIKYVQKTKRHTNCDRKECNNSRGITLVLTVVKMYKRPLNKKQ